MTPTTTGKPPTTDEQLTARVEALEQQMEDVGLYLASLDERVAALEAEGPPIEPPAVVAGDLVVELILPDGTLRFAQAEATDIGDYLGQFVLQHCRMQRQGAWVVFFRPDIDGGRNEIVVEYGGYPDLSTLPPVPVIEPVHITAPYTARISDSTGTLATIEVPQHWWLARWRWQSAPRPVVRGAADLVALKAVLPLSAEAAWHTSPTPMPVVWDGPMGTAGLATYMGTTGGRPEIGFITEYQASYLLNTDAHSLTSTLAQAEAAGSFPIWVRDTAGMPFNVREQPYLALRSDAFGGPNKIATPPNPDDPSFFLMDAAHLPAISFVAWMLTDDPFYLEGCQACANYTMLETNYSTNLEQLPGLTSTDQTRGFAWGMRDLFRMALFSPEAPPLWLLPRSYWRESVADNWTYAGKYMASTAPAVANFHLMTESGYWSSFMEDYLQIVMSWAKWTGGFPEWDETVAWLAAPRLAMVSETAGWDRRFPTPYQAPISNARVPDTLLTNQTYTQSGDPALTPADWTELWSCYRQWAGLDMSDWQPDVLAPNQDDWQQVAETRGALAALALAGIPEARIAHDWLHQQIATVMPPGITTDFKWAIWPT